MISLNSAYAKERKKENVKEGEISLSRESSVCTNVAWRPGQIIPVEAALYRQVHIALPENSVDVIWGAKELWEIGWVRNHIFIKPLSETKIGEKTVVTVIGESNNSYNIIVRRAAQSESPVPCAIVTFANSGGMLSDSKAWQMRENKQQAELNSQFAQQQLARERDRAVQDKEKLLKSVDETSREWARNYRKSIYSNYKWNKATGFFAQEGTIDSVYDDGRFTYVKLKREGSALMSIIARIDGKDELLEFNFDAATKVYQISGVFPAFWMRADKSEVVITRGGAEG